MRTQTLVRVLVVLVLLLAGCSGTDDEAETPSPAPSGDTTRTSPSPSRTASPSEPPPSVAPTPRMEEQTAAPEIERIPDRQWRAIVKAGVWRPGCPVSRNQLRLVKVNHHTFDGGIKRGSLVVNRDVAESVVRIFTRLFEIEFPIRRMRPVEHYDGDVKASLSADNTSAFNCRRPNQINAPVKESPHANGRAIDVNPRENPWVDLRCRCWTPGPENRRRTPGPGKIRKGGPVWKTFRHEGWIWQNIDVPDYMHFDTGYPSRPFRR